MRLRQRAAKELKGWRLWWFAIGALAVSAAVWWPIEPSTYVPTSPISVEPRGEAPEPLPLPSGRPSRPPHPIEIYRVPADPSTLTDGEYIVGKTVQPGTYRWRINHGAFLCGWEKFNRDGEPVDAWLLYATDGKADFADLVVSSKDYRIRIQGCGKWHRVVDR